MFLERPISPPTNRNFHVGKEEAIREKALMPNSCPLPLIILDKYNSVVDLSAGYGYFSSIGSSLLITTILAWYGSLSFKKFDTQITCWAYRKCATSQNENNFLGNLSGKNRM